LRTIDTSPQRSEAILAGFPRFGILEVLCLYGQRRERAAQFMGRVGNEPALFVHELAHSLQQAIDRVDERNDFVGNVRLGERRRSIRRLTVQAMRHSPHRCQFGRDDARGEPRE